MLSLWRRWVVVGLVFYCCIAVVGQTITLFGCAVAVPRDQQVDTRDEIALIVWDPKSKIEHFVRQASFETQATDFGFLVPTPSLPDLGEVDPRIYTAAAGMTAPQIIYKKEFKTVFSFLPEMDKAPRAAAAPGASPLPTVEILKEQQVAGYDATVLRADDSQALADWLNERGYESRPALTEWLKWYVDHHWIITAFKLSKAGRENIEARALRMSFRTEQPYYPYREPEDMRHPSGQGARKLRVFFLSDQKYEGQLGDNGTWPAKTMWADNVSGQTERLLAMLKITDADLVKTVDDVKYLTEFEDVSFPRPGTDEVYFRPAEDQSKIERPPIVKTFVVERIWPGPWGAVALVGLIIAVAIRVWLRRIIVRSRKR